MVVCNSGGVQHTYMLHTTRGCKNIAGTLSAHGGQKKNPEVLASGGVNISPIVEVSFFTISFAACGTGTWRFHRKSCTTLAHCSFLFKGTPSTN